MITCPKCNRDGIYWDGRAKIIFCPWTNCHHFIRNIPEWKNKVPTEKEVQKKINENEEDKINNRFEILDL